MSKIKPAHFELLKTKLDNEFVPHLPEIQDATKTPEQLKTKNLSRAFSAFVLQQLCRVSAQTAANAVTDDFEDKGIDAIYYSAPNETLYLIQSKLKESGQFGQDEANAFCQGVRKLIQQDLTGFNRHIQQRAVHIQDVVEKCAHIQLVVAYTGDGISQHARTAINELLTDTTHGEDRFCADYIAYDAEQAVRDLQEAEAPALINDTIYIDKHSSIEEPRKTHFGRIRLLDLVALYQQHGPGLYEKNIRTFLGRKTDVNAAIRRTLALEPANFFYLNNGVTALAHTITAKGPRAGDRYKSLDVTGFSIVNGAQTITSAAEHIRDCPSEDISSAFVTITLIEVAANDDFGKAITQARNYQNQVSAADFAALDDEQERLRRDLALLNVHYVYKGGADATTNANTIRIEEAAYALALFGADPRFVVWLKREPGRLLTVESDQYKALFSSSLTAQQLINAVYFRRYVQQRIANELRSSNWQEKLTYRHGEHTLGWVLAQQVRRQQTGHLLMDPDKIRDVLSLPFDKLRQTLWDGIQPFLAYKGPLAVFRNQTDVIQLLERLSISVFGLTNETALAAKRSQQNPDDPYPVDLFTYILDKTPQLADLT
ncbi:MAG: AIPR family protein [Spirosoma sp.]|nr:AIPR family protein [Spirosoma sp.]